jgi:mono/diheme cytochrome c family protein
MKIAIGIGITVLLACAPFLLAGCGSARRGRPRVGTGGDRKEFVEQGQKVFMTYCHQCHPGGEAGVGPALNNKPLPGFLIKLQVRQGFGAMPAFSEETIDDFKLEALVAYLFRLRNAPEN